MKIKEGFMLKEVGGKYVAVALGEASRDFNGIIRMNDTGKLLWETLSRGCTKEELSKTLASEYGIDEEQAKADTSDFLDKLRGAALLDE